MRWAVHHLQILREWVLLHGFQILFVAGAALLGVGIATIVAFRMVVYGRWRPPSAKFLGYVALGGLASTGAAVAIVFVIRGFGALVRVTGLRQAQAIVASLVIGAGVIAHWFKRNNQLLYGMIEVCFGAVSAISIVAGMSPAQALFSRWVALAGCAYVVARGLNNISDGNKVLWDAFRVSSPIVNSSNSKPPQNKPTTKST